MLGIQRAVRRFYATVDGPSVTRFTLHAPKCVEVEFGNGSVFNLSAEFLRVHSPAVDAKIRSIAGEKVISGRRLVGIMSAEPVGNYGVRVVFDDLHRTGIDQEQCEAFCDVGTHLFCHPCALCQEGREVRRRLPHPGFNAQPVLVMIPPGEQAMGRGA